MSKDRDSKAAPPARMTRRGFMSTVGLGAAGAAMAPGLGRGRASAGGEEVRAGEMVPLSLQVNGLKHRLLAEPRWTLLFVLRERLGLTGAKPGCERGECGACTVLIDGLPRYSCLTLALEAEGAEITTIEGLMEGEKLGELQEAFVEHDAFQCGYCTPGQIMAAEGLLRADPDPEPEKIRREMSGNLCRCGAYAHIVQAVASASAGRGK